MGNFQPLTLFLATHAARPTEFFPAFPVFISDFQHLQYFAFCHFETLAIQIRVNTNDMNYGSEKIEIRQQILKVI